LLQSNLEQLRRELLQEAKSAPKLFSDLAKVEQYLAESYRTRALIELIQNADDADATSFGLYASEHMLVVGNNGRPFTPADVEALCRSGSSTKQRGGNTIGYRGIGFKSVVNLARRIYVFSGAFSFCFDKRLTQQALGHTLDVPLIRMPHPLAVEDEALAQEMQVSMQRLRYRTLFVFRDIDERLSNEDLLGLDRSSLLFLNHIHRVDLTFGDIARSITREDTSKAIVRIAEGQATDEWRVLSAAMTPVDRIALKVRNEIIIPAAPEESVVHSFTPTLEFAGAYLKVNGDYTTDPSRKHIDMDDYTQRSLREAAKIVSSTVAGILGGDNSHVGFFAPFVGVEAREAGHFRAAFFKAIQQNLQSLTIRTKPDRQVSFASIRLRPEWLNYEDYEALCQRSIAAVPKALIVAYPEISAFLGMFGPDSRPAAGGGRLEGCERTLLGRGAQRRALRPAEAVVERRTGGLAPSG